MSGFSELLENSNPVWEVRDMSDGSFRLLQDARETLAVAHVDDGRVTQEEVYEIAFWLASKAMYFMYLTVTATPFNMDEIIEVSSVITYLKEPAMKAGVRAEDIDALRQSALKVEDRSFKPSHSDVVQVITVADGMMREWKGLLNKTGKGTVGE